MREIPYREAARIYQTIADQPLPLSEREFAEVSSPEYMVFGRVGVGGPQLAEVDRMLAGQGELLAADKAWTDARIAELSQAEAMLDAAAAAVAVKSTHD